MAHSYRIAILNDDSSETLIEAIVQLTGTNARITMIRAGSAINEGVPKEIADVDLSILARAAATLAAAPGLTAGMKAHDLQANLPELGMDNHPSPQLISTTRETSAEIKAAQIDAGSSRTPEMPTDFGVTYWRLGSIVKVSKYYDVSHHTAAEWIKTLQRQGKVSNPWPKKGTRPLRK